MHLGNSLYASRLNKIDSDFITTYGSKRKVLNLTYTITFAHKATRYTVLLLRQHLCRSRHSIKLKLKGTRYLMLIDRGEIFVSVFFRNLHV